MQETDDLRELLRRLTRDRDATVKLRAIEALLKWDERRGCATCAERATGLPADWLDRATPDQLDDLRAVLIQVKRLKAVIIAQPIQPQTVPERSSGQNARTDLDAGVESCDEKVPEPASVEHAGDAREHDVPIALYKELGLSILDDGTVTHALGDEYAARIVAGDVGIDVARAGQHAAMRSLHQIEASNRTE